MSDIYYHGPVVAFDLDDTLFRERDFCRSGFKWLCDRAGVPASLAEEMDRELTARRNPFEPYEKFFLQNGINGFDLQQEIADYRAHLPSDLQAAPGAMELLETLNRKGIKLAIITDGRSVTQRNKIKVLGLDAMVASENILISEETGFDKNTEVPFATLVRKYPEAGAFFYIGDNNAKDFYFPNLLGWTTVKIAYNPDNVHPETVPESPLHEASFEIADFSELEKLLTDRKKV